MSDDTDVPGVTTSESIGDIDMGVGVAYVHVDDVDLDDYTDGGLYSLRVYVFSRERFDELEACLEQLEAEYVLATGIVFPEQAEPLVRDGSLSLLELEQKLRTYDEIDEDVVTEILEEVRHE